MFHDLDRTLKAILDDTEAPAELLKADVSFAVPDSKYSLLEKIPTVNLFMHGVKENRELRDNAPTVAFQNGIVTSTPSPLRVDCTYLVTAWQGSDPEEKDPVAREHELLGQALLWLSRFPVIPPMYLQGSLTDQPYDVPMQVGQMPGDGGMGQFWTALGISPRPSFSLTVTIALQVLEAKQPPDDIVKEIDTTISDYMYTAPVLQGTVKDTAGRPVPAATVSARGTGKIATTDADGQFRLEGLAPGAYRLLVQATGFATLEQRDVRLTIPPQSYDLIVKHPPN
jgi:hypothetical protein